MKVLRLKEVSETTGLARSTIYKLMAEGHFPRSIPLTGRIVGWLKSEVDSWIQSRVEARDS